MQFLQKTVPTRGANMSKTPRLSMAHVGNNQKVSGNQEEI